MNMCILKKSRYRPTVGDIFVYKMESLQDHYYFGRVIRTDAAIGGFKDTTLIYLYKQTSQDKKAVPDLKATDLLVPPIATNALPWSKGYFETVSTSTLDEKDVLVQHCFKDFRGKIFDADGRPLAKIVEPVGDYGLHSYRTIDDAISKALGLPLAAD